MKNKDITIALLDKQNEVYSNLIEKLTLTIPVIEKFEGKILNVKLNRELQLISNMINSSDNENIKVYESDRATKVNNNWYYVDYSDSKVVIIVDEKRINSKLTIENINHEIGRLEKRIKDNENSIKQYDECIREYELICKQIKEFNNKYSYKLREDINFSRVY